MKVEIIGIIATLFILASMLFKTNTIKGALIMRSINLVGSAVFVVYGILLPTLSTAILNGALIIVNGYHIIRLCKTKKDENIEKTEEHQTVKISSDNVEDNAN